MLVLTEEQVKIMKMVKHYQDIQIQGVKDGNPPNKMVANMIKSLKDDVNEFEKAIDLLIKEV